jgi:hypothetical protein
MAETPEGVFFIEPDYDGPLLDKAVFDGPGWYFWGGRVPVGDVEGPYDTEADARTAQARYRGF